MTTEHDTNDPRVSGAYRDLAGEKTPAELDRKVLAMAATEARTRYGLTRFWIRPVAWAATIGLSLAFILEVSQFADTPIFGTAPDADIAIEERFEDEGGAHRDLQKRGDAPQPLSVSAPPAAERAAHESASPTSNGEALVMPESKAVAQDAVSGGAGLVLEAEDMRLLRDAEEQARMQAGEALPAAAAALAPRKEKPRYCDDEQRSAATTWYECIEELRAQGLADAASDELVAMQEAFPAFREPARQ